MVTVFLTSVTIAPARMTLQTQTPIASQMRAIPVVPYREWDVVWGWFVPESEGRMTEGGPGVARDGRYLGGW